MQTNTAPPPPSPLVWHWEAPLHLESELNLREAGPKGRIRRARDHRQTTLALCRTRCGAPPKPPVRVTITRIGKARLDDDNLAGGAKHVRDGIADWLGVHDDDPGIRWIVQQERVLSAPPAVRVEIRAFPGATPEALAAWWLLCEVTLVQDDAHRRWGQLLPPLKPGGVRAAISSEAAPFMAIERAAADLATQLRGAR